MIKIYGITPTRTARCLWMLGELGLEYEQVEVSLKEGEHKKPDYLALNPNGRVPTMVDGDLTLWESMAINLYLADKYDGGLKLKTPEDRARAVQWSFWGMTEIEPKLMTVLRNRVLKAEDERDAALGDEAEQELQAPLGVLNGALEGRDHLLDGDFSVADLNLAAITSWAKVGRVKLEPFPNVARWLSASLARPTYQKLFPGRG